MIRALLDVNVLLALMDADHTAHERAHEWLRRQDGNGWATCAITENGFVRIMSQDRYPNSVTTAEAMSLLRRSTEASDHEFWSCEVSLLDREAVVTEGILGPKQVTDAYLLALAVTRGGRLVTLDQRVTPAAVVGAAASHLVVL